MENAKEEIAKDPEEKTEIAGTANIAETKTDPVDIESDSPETDTEAKEKTTDAANIENAETGGVNKNQAKFPIVGIGASAGGLEALQEFFDNMIPDPGAAFVVIQHLSPDYKSL